MPTHILVANANQISSDHHEQIAMWSYSALGSLTAAANLLQNGYTMNFSDSFFRANEDILPTNVRLLMRRFEGTGALVIGGAIAREQFRARNELGCIVFTGGPGPSIGPGTSLRECGGAG